MAGETSAYCNSCGIGAFYVVVDSGQCSGRSNYCWLPEGVDNLGSADHAIRLYPNPANSQLTISSADRVTTVAISNLVGQTVYAHNFNSTQVQVDVSQLPADIYLIRINGTHIRKFLKD